MIWKASEAKGIGLTLHFSSNNCVEKQIMKLSYDNNYSNVSYLFMLLL